MEQLYTVSKNTTGSWLWLSGSAESYPLDHQGSPWTICFIVSHIVDLFLQLFVVVFNLFLYSSYFL